jgi:hypothetical protein
MNNSFAVIVLPVLGMATGMLVMYIWMKYGSREKI